MKRDNKSLNNDYLQISQKKLYKLYSNNLTNKYNLLTINSILSNRKCHLVSIFKDYLLYDDLSEFFKRYYKKNESNIRIKKLSKYHKDTSIIYANYSPLIESKYMYSNIIKKQLLINKQENYKKKVKNNMLKKHYQEKNEDDKINGKIFFNSTIYNDILNESESFMSLLFGIEKKNKNNKNKRVTDNEKEMEDLIKIIDIIENNEVILKKKEINDNDVVNSNNSNNIKNERKITDIDLKKTNKDFINNHRKIFNKLNSNNSKTNKYKKNFKNVIKIQKLNKNLLENYKNNEASKENNNFTNSTDIKPDTTVIQKTIYHRKINSTLIGDYLNKLELPSNSNVINLLKNANETYADSMNKNSKRSIIYQTMKTSNGFEMKNSTNKIINLTKIVKKNPLKEIKGTNPINILESKTELLISPKNLNSRNINKFENISKKIEIIKLYKKSNFFESNNKRNSPVPLSNRNNNSIVSLYENNKNFTTSKTISNRNILNNIYNNDTSHSIYSTNKKPENNGFKSIYVNPNFTGPYTKQKCHFYKDKKYNGISAKKLFSITTDLSNNEKEKKN